MSIWKIVFVTGRRHSKGQKKCSMNLQCKKIISSITYENYVGNVTNSDKHSRIFE